MTRVEAILFLLALLAVFLWAGQVDYEEARRDECWAQGWGYNPRLDACY